MEHFLNLGIRGHDLASLPLERLLANARSYGLSHVQLALGMSFPALPSDYHNINHGMARYTAKAFRQADLDISVLSCYINMIHPDQAIRRHSLEKFKSYLRYARDFGASLVATETGNVNSDIIYCEENFTEVAYQAVLTSVKELVAEAEQFGVFVGIEAGLNHPIYSPTVLKRLLDDVNSNNMQVVLDPTNLINVKTWQQQEQLIEQAFALFGDRIAVVHLKDFIIEDDRMRIVAVGEGQMNFSPLLRLIKQQRPMLFCVLEETKAPYIESAVSKLTALYRCL